MSGAAPRWWHKGAFVGAVLAAGTWLVAGHWIWPLLLTGVYTAWAGWEDWFQQYECNRFIDRLYKNLGSMLAPLSSLEANKLAEPLRLRIDAIQSLSAKRNQLEEWNKILEKAQVFQPATQIAAVRMLILDNRELRNELCWLFEPGDQRQKTQLVDSLLAEGHAQLKPSK